jgi:AcrR family transcriptional regulator
MTRTPKTRRVAAPSHQVAIEQPQAAAAVERSVSRGRRLGSVRLGRPPGASVAQDTLLDAAEEAFANSGYASTSLQQIAVRAGVTPALVRYYFGSKEGLFTAIFLRRGHELRAERIAILDALEQRTDGTPAIEEIVRAYLAPAFNLKRRGAGGVAFMRLQARLQNEPPEVTGDLQKTVYEEAMQRYIAALWRALPQVDPKAIYWRMVFMVGAYFYTISDVHRLDTLSGGTCDPRDLDEAFRQLVSFFVGGLSAPVIAECRLP